MANSALSKLIETFKTPQHDYKLNTEVFGQFDAEKVAKELNLEKIGTEKGTKNQPSHDSQIPDEIESQIQERIEAAKSTANEAAENQILTYNERISNLDFEGHFSELRQAGPLAISDIQSQIQRGLNEMNTRRRKLLDVEKEFSYFRSYNGLEYRTAKLTTPTGTFLRFLIILIMIVLETYFNGTYLAKGSTQGLIGGIFEAASFALLNIGFSIILTLYMIKQIVRNGLIWKLIGVVGILAWLAVVLVINLGLAHYREVAATFAEGAGSDILVRIVENPFGLVELESWMLFAIGVLFATVTLVDIITFSDIYPGYTKRQMRWDEEHEEYKDEFDSLIQELDDIKEDYNDNLKTIGNALSSRQRELDNIMSGRNRLASLYAAHHEQLQRAANSLFSYYFEANRASRTTPVPERFNRRFIVSKMELSSSKSFQPREAQKVKDRISEAKKILDDQVQLVLAEYAKGIRQYRNLDILNKEYAYGEEPKVKE
ncbi:hypothetical protein N9X02_03835 [Planktomarina temperata]|nr:hypothetical protein [Planktomarina temperata]